MSGFFSKDFSFFSGVGFGWWVGGKCVYWM